ncbi:hypothetical protein CK203_025499 [Vitis vinifera]|uniref:Uncharacterized protein n=1 Tax=Vitis vinifera TaxID=29760 RepID=A0A438IEK9_VITVI|nr:hypothetical protein CK203_025499 [Vitis vinifera]
MGATRLEPVSLPSLRKTHFIETIIPNFKHSLVLALRHFYFFAGNLRASFWIIKTSQAKERSKEKQRGKSSKVKKTEDSSCSLPSHFWSTSRSPFSTFYIPFQRSGSQESNALNRVRFGAEMRKI